MNISILKPCGFCAGVQRVMDLIEQICLSHPNQNIYCLGQVVHNNYVNEELKKKGIIITSSNKDEALNQISSGVVIFSAHGTDQKLVQKAINKNLIVYNTICPFVQKEFSIINEKIKEGYHILYIGVKNHDETLAALSISEQITLIENENDLVSLNLKTNKIAVINQTTLPIDSLYNLHKKIKSIYPDSIFIDEICDSTRKRQNAIHSIDDDCDGLIIVGDQHSNNTKSLYKIAKDKGLAVIMVQEYNFLLQDWLKGKKNLLITSGASTSIKKVEEIYKIIKNI